MDVRYAHEIKLVQRKELKPILGGNLFPYKSGVELTLHGKPLCRAEWRPERLVAAFKLYFGYVLIFDDTPYEIQTDTWPSWWRVGEQKLCIELRNNDFQLVECNRLSVEWARLNSIRKYGAQGNITPAFDAIALQGQNVIAFKPVHCRCHKLTILQNREEIASPSKMLRRDTVKFDCRLRRDVGSAFLPENQTHIFVSKSIWSVSFQAITAYWDWIMARGGGYISPFWRTDAAEKREGEKFRETYYESDQDRFPPYPLYDGPWPPWGLRARLKRLWNRLLRRPNGQMIQYRPE